ncbi:MAG: putative quinol monooxygenase [Pseudomonadales bacterium]
MTVGIIATLTVQEGKNEEFESVFSELVQQVRANEPDNLLYAIHRSRTDSQVYKVLEQYTNDAAIEAHGKTDYFRAAGAKLAGCLAAAPEIETLDEV